MAVLPLVGLSVLCGGSCRCVCCCGCAVLVLTVVAVLLSVVAVLLCGALQFSVPVVLASDSKVEIHHFSPRE